VSARFSHSRRCSTISAEDIASALLHKLRERWGGNPYIPFSQVRARVTVLPSFILHLPTRWSSSEDGLYILRSIAPIILCVSHFRSSQNVNMFKSILLINGPNLNLLGTREPHLYGSTTLPEVVSTAVRQADGLGIKLQHFQSNHEGAIVDRIQEARGECQFVIINPGALTHTSVAIRDALLGVDLPFVELHLTNVHAREPWRRHSYLSDKAVAVVCGLGTFGYTAAIAFVAQTMRVSESLKL